MPALLVVRDLHKSYVAGLGRCRAQVQVLRGVSLSVSAGERMAVLGAPASGKTTLLHCVAGLRRPDAGHIRWARRTDERGAREICTRPSELLSDAEPLLVDLSEEQHTLVDWSECLRQRAAPGASWILVARRLGPLTHLCDTVVHLENGLLRPRTGAPATRRVAEAVRRS